MEGSEGKIAFRQFQLFISSGLNPSVDHDGNRRHRGPAPGFSLRMKVPHARVAGCELVIHAK